MTPLQLTWRPATCDPRTSEEPGRQEKTRRDKRRQECTNHFRINLAVIQPSCHLFTRALFCCHCKCNLWSFSFAIFKVNRTEREEIPKIWGELDSLGSLLNLTHLWGTFKSRLYHFAEIGYSCVLEYPFWNLLLRSFHYGSLGPSHWVVR